MMQEALCESWSFECFLRVSDIDQDWGLGLKIFKILQNFKHPEFTSNRTKDMITKHRYSVLRVFNELLLKN